MYPPQQPPPGYPPYPPPQQMPPQMPPQMMMYTPPLQNDGKATASLVLGILSLFCFGPLAGIPAIILGVMAKRDIARSNGSIGGEGLAIGGIVTGILSTVMFVGTMILYIAVIGAAVASTPSYTPPPYTPYTAYTIPTVTPTTPPVATGLKPMPYTGMLKVVDLKTGGGSLRTQIALELGAAKDDSDKILVITASRSCHACDEVFSTFSNYTLQRSLRGVRVVRVDVDTFPSELAALGLDKTGQPWFFRFDDTMKVVDSISADEWDDNDAYNIGPVLKSFMLGTYKKRATLGADGGTVMRKPPIGLSQTF